MGVPGELVSAQAGHKDLMSKSSYISPSEGQMRAMSKINSDVMAGQFSESYEDLVRKENEKQRKVLQALDPHFTEEKCIQANEECI